jgi:hypothetical protein
VLFIVSPFSKDLLKKSLADMPLGGYFKTT